MPIQEILLQDIPEKSRRDFPRIVNRLLGQTFLYQDVDGEKDDYYFVHNYLLDENLLDVKTLQAQLETLRHFKSLAADVRERIDSLTHIEDLDKERLANRRRRITNTYVARRAQADVFLDELKSRRLELDSAKLEFHRDEIQRDDLTRNLRFAQSALTDAEIALHTDQTAQREKELHEKIASLTAELTLLTQRQTDFDRSLATELTDAKKLKNSSSPTNSKFLLLLPYSSQNTQHATRIKCSV